MMHVFFLILYKLYVCMFYLILIAIFFVDNIYIFLNHICIISYFVVIVINDASFSSSLLLTINCIQI